LPADVRPRAYVLDLAADPSTAGYTGKVTIRLAVETPHTILWLHGRGLTVTRAETRFHDRDVTGAFAQINPDGLAKVTLSAAVGPGDVLLTLEFSAPFRTERDGFFKVTSSGATYALTQFEVLSARTAFPCFDEPAFKAPLTLSLTAPAPLVVAANTDVDRSEALAGPGTARTRWHFRPTAPLPTYLYAWAVGPFDVVTAPPVPPDRWRARPLPLRGIAPRGRGAELAQSLALAPELVRRIEDYFEIGFPFEKLDLLAAPDFLSGAMENAGLITFNDSLLLVDEQRTPFRLRQEWVVSMAHELIHQWFGDLVTLTWWDDIWLNESFTEWLTYMVAAQVRPRDRFTLLRADLVGYAMREDSLVTARMIRQTIQTSGDVENMFDLVTYEKGASLIGMFEAYLGAPAFQRAIHAYLLAHASGNATAADFLSAIDRVTGQDTSAAFRTFIDQPGVPFVEAKVDCADDAVPTLSLTQSRFLPVGSIGNPRALWQIPICIRHGTGDRLDTTCTLLKGQSARLELPPAKVDPVPSSGAARSGCPRVVFPNADGRGYFLWSLSGPALRALVGARGLSVAERLSLAQSLVAAYRTAALPAAEAFPALEGLARDPEPEVSASFIALLREAREHLLDPGDRPAVMRRTAEIYRPVLDQVGLTPARADEDVRVSERRSWAAYALAVVAEEPAVLRKLAVIGDAYLRAGPGGDRKASPERIDPGIGRTALRATLAIHPARFDPWVERLVDEANPVVRDQLLGALCSDPDPAHAARMRELALEPDSGRSHLRLSERTLPLLLQVQDARTRPAAWAWLEGHLDALPTAEALDRANLPKLGSSFCTDGEARKVEALFRPRLATMPGAERALAQTLETIHNCAALVTAQRASARSYFVPSAAHAQSMPPASVP
jgi:alanyl aminopeptidase